MCLWVTTVRVCVHSTSKDQSWSARKEALDYQCRSYLRECCLSLCGCCKRAALSVDLCGWSCAYGLCLCAHWEYVLSLTTGCTWDTVLTASHWWEWDRRILCVFNSIKLGSSGPGRSTPPAPELHWIQQALAALIFNFRRLKNMCQLQMQNNVIKKDAFKFF